MKHAENQNLESLKESNNLEKGVVQQEGTQDGAVVVTSSEERPNLVDSVGKKHMEVDGRPCPADSLDGMRVSDDRSKRVLSSIPTLVEVGEPSSPHGPTGSRQLRGQDNFTEPCVAQGKALELGHEGIVAWCVGQGKAL